METYYSRYSLDCVKANLQCVQYLMTGKGYGNMNGIGIHTLMTGTNQQIIYNNISSHLAADFNCIQNISVPLDQAVQDNNNDANALYDETKALVKLIKSDLCSALHISVTFTDSDGD